MAMAPSQSALGLTVRSKVVRSTAMRPNVGRYPATHSKLSSALQWMYPLMSMPSSSGPQAVEGVARVDDSPLIVVGGDAVFGNEDGHAAGHLPGVPDGLLERVGPVLPPGPRHLGAVGDGQRAIGADPDPRVSLDADEVVTSCSLEEEVFARMGPCSRDLLGAICGMEVLVGHRPPHEEAIDGPHHLDGPAVGADQRLRDRWIWRGPRSGHAGCARVQAVRHRGHVGVIDGAHSLDAVGHDR